MNISGKISSARFRDIVLDSWRLGRMEWDLRAADLVREIKRRLLAELQANAEAAASADCRPGGSGAEAAQTALDAPDGPAADPAAGEPAEQPAAGRRPG
ncbi:hypothetical protein Theco_3165 [Thermobacillus composti KWC4]|uniref:Uncharacterized protein n=1 Tax=Thermobacillus composti (strain DSM 18247 / JCM 13945 / KWC4) TaxID=717605 RepID=L0EHQ2_THECK|nr:hypothetical protein [Thermobacillus composti]AGA59221.1 hypothetical protein Theco_3165 [Thermobacillus composti KWC4]